jgi:hypothetical protein
MTNQNNESPQKNYTYYFLGALLLLFIIVFKYVFNSKLDLNGDNFNYLIYARSILSGHGYSSLMYLGYPPANHYPPGFSAILSLFMMVVGENIVSLKILNGLFLYGSVAVLYSFFVKISGQKTLSFSIAGLLLLNDYLYHFATMLMSETSYLFFSVLAIYALYKLAERNDFWRSKYFYMMVVSAVTAYYLRAIGITLFGGILIYYLFQRKWKLAGAFAGGYFLLYLPWIIRNATLGLKSRYLGVVMTVNPWRPEEGNISSVSEFIDKMLKNLDETVIKGFTQVIFPFIKPTDNNPSGMPGILWGILVVAIILYGAWMLKKYRWLFIAYILGNIFIFSIWHGGNGTRYVVPLIPFIVFTFYFGIYYLLKLLAENSFFTKYYAYLILIFAFFMLSPLQETHKISAMPYPPAYKNYFEIAKTVGQRTPENTIVSCRKEGMFYWFSHRYSMRYKYTLDDKELIQNLIDKNFSYVVLDQLGYSSTYRYLYPAIQKNTDLFSTVMVEKNPDTYLLYFNREKAIEKLKGH